MSMKRIVLAALDYGLAFGVDRAIRDLVAGNRLTAVGCLVTSDLWSREYLPLREAVEDAGGRTRVGLSVTLTRPYAPLSPAGRDTFGERFPRPGYYARRGALGLLPRAALKAEIGAQIDRFEEFYGAAPAFVALPGLERRTGIARQAFEALRERDDAPPMLVLGEPSGLRARLLARRVRRHGGATSPDLTALPNTRDPEVLHRFFWRGLQGRRDDTWVACRPAHADDRLRKLLPPAEIDIRAAQFAYLTSQEFLMALSEKDVFLF